MKAVWSGLPTLLQEINTPATNPLTREDELTQLGMAPLDVKAGFTLCNPDDPVYQKVASHRRRFGEVVRKAAIALQQSAEGEDGIRH